MGESDWDKIGRQIEHAFDKGQIALLEHIEPLAQGLQHRPDEFISHIHGVLERALDDFYTDDEGNNHRSLVQTLAGGPHEGIPVAVYNAVGAVYPYLSRQQKDRALAAVLSEMDKLNCLYVQALHTPNVREPLLLADIFTARWIYFPGLDEAKGVVKECPTFFDMHNEWMDDQGLFRNSRGQDVDGAWHEPRVHSDFLLAYGLLRSDVCPYGKEYLAHAHPSFIRRVAQGIAAMTFPFTTPAEKKHNLASLEKRLPPDMFSMVRDAEYDGVTDPNLCRESISSYNYRLREEQDAAASEKK